MQNKMAPNSCAIIFYDLRTQLLPAVRSSATAGENSSIGLGQLPRRTRMSTAPVISADCDAADAVLNALPHPVIVVAADGKVVEANAAAEAFFEVSLPLACAATCCAISCRSAVPCSPWSSRCARAALRSTSTRSISARRVIPAIGSVDLHVTPLPEQPDYVVVMLQERIDRRQDGPPAHPSRRRAFGDRACRHAGARNQKSAVRHSRRGANCWSSRSATKIER